MYQRIPFDSNLMRQEINIPEGFKAEISGNKIVFEKIEPEQNRIIDNLASELKNLLVRGLIKDETYVKYGNFLKSLKTKMQNGIIINGVEYELVKDMDTRRCDRCALSKQCHDYDGADGEKFICFDLFSDMAINCRFERRQSEQKLL
jgi:hypothetical protein